MYQGLTSILEDVATWLLSASQSVPISQLSIATWAVFLISGAFSSKTAFNVAEQ
jgi:hypothetical protein